MSFVNIEFNYVNFPPSPKYPRPHKLINVAVKQIIK